MKKLSSLENVKGVREVIHNAIHLDPNVTKSQINYIYDLIRATYGYKVTLVNDIKNNAILIDAPKIDLDELDLRLYITYLENMLSNFVRKN